MIKRENTKTADCELQPAGKEKQKKKPLKQNQTPQTD